MYQVAFATDESTWTRKRNKDFLALQLKVHQAVLEAQKELVVSPSVCARVWSIFFGLQPHLHLRRFSVLFRAHMRALLLAATIFGRVALSVLYFAVAGNTLTAESDDNCARPEIVKRYTVDIARGVGLEFLFGVVNAFLYMIWGIVLGILHNRQFVYGAKWDAAARQRQVRIWFFKDLVYGCMVLIYVGSCALLAVSFLCSVHAVDGNRWLVSFATMLLWNGILEPCSLSILLAVSATVVARTRPALISEKRCLGLEHLPVSELSSVAEEEATKPFTYRSTASRPTAPSS